MSESSQLTRAYELIEADRLDEARGILTSIVAAEPDNADAWWLYAHAVSEPAEAREALQNVMRIDPNYPGAQQLYNTLEQEYPAAQPARAAGGIKPLGTPSARPPATLPGMADDEIGEDLPDFLDDDDFDVDVPDLDDDEDFDGESGAPRRRLTLPMIIGLVAIVAILAIVLVLVILSGQSPVAESTAEATGIALGTEEPTSVTDEPATDETAEVQPTPEEAATDEDDLSIDNLFGGDDDEEPTPEGDAQVVVTDENIPTPEGAAFDSQQIVDAFSVSNLAAEAVEVMDTELGQTVVVTVCASAEDVRTTVSNAMDVLAQQNITDMDAVGVRLNDCEQGTTLRVVGVSLQDAADYASGTIDADEFQSRWQPVG